MSRSSLVTEEMSNWCECTSIGLGSLSLLELLINEVSNQFLGLELGEVNIGTTKLLVVDNLSLHEIWKSDVQRVRPWCEFLSSLVVILVELLKEL